MKNQLIQQASTSVNQEVNSFANYTKDQTVQKKNSVTIWSISDFKDIFITDEEISRIKFSSCLPSQAKDLKLLLKHLLSYGFVYDENRMEVIKQDITLKEIITYCPLYKGILFRKPTETFDSNPARKKASLISHLWALMKHKYLSLKIEDKEIIYNHDSNLWDVEDMSRIDIDTKITLVINYHEVEKQMEEEEEEETQAFPDNSIYMLAADSQKKMKKKVSENILVTANNILNMVSAITITNIF